MAESVDSPAADAGAAVAATEGASADAPSSKAPSQTQDDAGAVDVAASESPNEQIAAAEKEVSSGAASMDLEHLHGAHDAASTAQSTDEEEAAAHTETVAAMDSLPSEGAREGEPEEELQEDAATATNHTEAVDDAVSAAEAAAAAAMAAAEAAAEAAIAMPSANATAEP